MRTTIQFRTNPVGDAMFNASRQVWLASLGAAAVTRDWAQTEAGNVFRTLVKEGTAVESRTIRVFGNKIETSFAQANHLWKQTRATVQSTVKQAATTAVTLVQNNLPKSLPKVTLPAMLTPKAPAKRKSAAKKRTVKARSAKTTKTTKPAKTVKRAKRTVRATKK